MNRPKPRRLLQTADWAVVVVVAAAYISFFTTRDVFFTAMETLVLVVLGLLFTVIGTFVFENYVFSAPLLNKIVYYGAQYPLVIAIALLVRFTGAFWLLLLPLVSHGAVLFDRIGVWIISMATTLIFGLLLGIPNGWQVGLTATLSFAPGVVFVVIFTRMAISEARARHQVELLAADLAEAHESLAQYAVQAEELATAKERNRLAREIHDSLGHYLTAINMQLEATRAMFEVDPPGAVQSLARAQTLAKEGLHEVRRSVAALRLSPLEGKPLPAVLKALSEELQSSGIAVTFAVQGEPHALSPQIDLALYRVAQEALTNIRKHARARRADVVLTYTPDLVRLKVQDDGIGYGSTGKVSSGDVCDQDGSVEHEVPVRGFGLIGVRERVQLLGGEFRCDAEPGEGFILEVSIPLQD